jgi:hypothetical protein
MSTEGEIAVYGGDDPSLATEWGLKGIYKIAKPLGKNAFIQAGGDILICTVSGLIPLSQVLQRNRETINLAAISRPIEDDWREVTEMMPYGWSITAWGEKTLALVTFPFTPVAPDVTYVLNTQTSKWSLITGWQARAYASIQGSLYFGDSTGQIWQANQTGSDGGNPFKAIYLSHFMPADGFGRRAQATMAHMVFKGKTIPTIRLFARADGNTTEPTGPGVSERPPALSEWDVSKWDEGIWDAGAEDTTRVRRRQNVRATGDTLALGCVVTSGGPTALQLDIDMGVLQVAGGESSA